MLEGLNAEKKSFEHDQKVNEAIVELKKEFKFYKPEETKIAINLGTICLLTTLLYAEDPLKDVGVKK